MMMQGFYLLALRRRRRFRLVLTAAALAAGCAVFAARTALAAPAVPAETAAPYVAFVENGRLAVAQGEQTVLRTDIDARTLPAADRERLTRGVLLPDEAALAQLLEDYGS